MIKFIKNIFSHVSFLIVAVAFAYTIFYLVASIDDKIFDYPSEYFRFGYNFLFACFVFTLTVCSRSKKIGNNETQEKEWNFAIAFCALTVTIIDPFAKFITSNFGYKIVESHILGISAFLISLLAIIVLLLIIGAGIKLSEPK